MDEAVLVPLFLFSTMAIIFWGGFKFSAQKREAALNTVRAVVEKTGEVSPELIDAIGSAVPRKNADLRKGMILIAIGILATRNRPLAPPQYVSPRAIPAAISCRALDSRSDGTPLIQTEVGTVALPGPLAWVRWPHRCPADQTHQYGGHL